MSIQMMDTETFIRKTIEAMAEKVDGDVVRVEKVFGEYGFQGTAEVHLEDMPQFKSEQVMKVLNEARQLSIELARHEFKGFYQDQLRGLLLTPEDLEAEGLTILASELRAHEHRTIAEGGRFFLLARAVSYGDETVYCGGVNVDFELGREKYLVKLHEERLETEKVMGSDLVRIQQTLLEAL